MKVPMKAHACWAEYKFAIGTYRRMNRTQLRTTIPAEGYGSVVARVAHIFKVGGLYDSARHNLYSCAHCGCAQSVGPAMSEA